MDGNIELEAKKRALYLLERMDRTEKQLSDKLLQCGYPPECVEKAVSYAKQFHYIDDRRYAANYVRYCQEKKSRMRLWQDLLRKGVDKELIEEALDEEFCSDELFKIRQLLEKKHYDAAAGDRAQQQRCYQFLLRRGFKGSDILKVMRSMADSL